MRPHVLTRHLRALLALLVATAALLGAASPAGAAGVQEGSFSVPKVDLGDVPLGSLVYRGVTLRSTGTAPLQPFSVSSSNPNAGDVLFFSQDFDKPLAPGASRRFYVGADPMTPGPVSTTMSVVYGDADGTQKSAAIRVKYNAVPAPVLPYAHFDLRLNDEGWNDFLFSNTKLRPIGGATGTSPGKFVFPISSGTVSATNTGVVSSAGGLHLEHTAQIDWSALAVDLTGHQLTAVVTPGGPRVAVANLPYVGDSYDIEGHPITYASVELSTTGAANLNKVGVRPKVAAGQFVGSIEILKP